MTKIEGKSYNLTFVFGDTKGKFKTDVKGIFQNLFSRNNLSCLVGKCQPLSALLHCFPNLHVVLERSFLSAVFHEMIVFVKKAI